MKLFAGSAPVIEMIFNSIWLLDLSFVVFVMIIVVQCSFNARLFIQKVVKLRRRLGREINSR